MTFEIIRSILPLINITPYITMIANMSTSTFFTPRKAVHIFSMLHLLSRMALKHPANREVYVCSTNLTFLVPRKGVSENYIKVLTLSKL